MKKYLILFFVAAAAAFQSCNNNDDLWDAIDDLKSRVQALETQVDALNGNVGALQTLYGGATISEVTESEGNYLITLTNGKTLTLVQGSEAKAVIPVISIDAQGNWQVSTDGGKSFTSLGVKAEAEDGVTPQFRVDESTGYWQVSYDSGKNFSNVLDTAGKPVSAVGSGEVTDKFFETVRVDGDNFYIKLLDGQELNIPILKDFICRIITTTEGVQMFDSGVTKRFDVEMRGVDAAIVTAPKGWTARLTDPVEEMAQLIVTAPGTLSTTTQTRATADASQDVAILATSGKYSCIAKIQVESTGAEAVAPTISIANSATVVPTNDALTFDVTLSSNADRWKYICQKSEVTEAPDAAKILAEGTPVAGTSVTVEGLEGETSYTIYAVAYVGDLTSEVASVSNTTAAQPVDPNDYYASGVEINGVRYDQNSEGARTLDFAADATEDDLLVTLPGSSTVSFIGKNESSYELHTKRDGGATIAADHVFIGRYADQRPVLKIGNYIALRNVGGTVAFKNLVVDCTEAPVNYSFLISSNTDGSQVGGLGTLVFEDCEIIFSKPALVSLSGAKANSIGNMIFRNCKIAYAGTANSNFIVANQTDLTGTDGFRSLVFENNIIYMTTEALASNVVFNGLNNTFSNLSIAFDHNTVVNYLPSGGQGAVMVAVGCASYASLTCNLFYSSPTLSRGSNVFGLRMTGGNPSSIGTMTPNAGYGVFGKATDTFKNYYGGAGGQMTIFTESPFSSTDFAGGKFVRTPEAAEYGSTLE